MAETGVLAQETVILGVESSCDDTAAAVLRAPAGPLRPGAAEILSSVAQGQADLHALYGGVVPEIAARAHVERLDGVIAAALREAGLTVAGVTAAAVTAGPGLIGGVLSGVVTAKAFAAARGLPLIGVNHLEGHALTPRLTDGLAYPYLLLLVSGGHCQILRVDRLGAYRRLGGSIDDSPGEAFDKIAKHLGLGFPGGPEVERRAREGDPARAPLPRPLLDRPGLDMSFSGLKTAARLWADARVAKQGGLTAQDIADLCAGFQAAVRDVLAEKTRRALAAAPDIRSLAAAGGVAANGPLRAALEEAAAAAGAAFVAPPLRYCTDNGAMIAWAGLERLAAGAAGDAEILARPRWPLDETATPMLGAGKRGPKA